MNQCIQIRYKVFSFDRNHWQIWFYLKEKTHREKAPSGLRSTGYWSWYIHDNFKKGGRDFDWSNQ